MKLFKEKLKTSGRRRKLAIFGETPRADWHVVLVIGALAIAAGLVYAEARLSAVEDAIALGELRPGGEDALLAPAAADVVAAMDARGPSPIAAAAPTASAATAPTIHAVRRGRRGIAESGGSAPERERPLPSSVEEEWLGSSSPGLVVVTTGVAPVAPPA